MYFKTFTVNISNCLFLPKTSFLLKQLVTINQSLADLPRVAPERKGKLIFEK